MQRLTAAVVLPIRLAWALVVSGLQTVSVILRNGLLIGAPPAAGFVRVAFAPMSPKGAALLGCMISLTPGTTVVDIDVPAREMVLHMLDTRDAGTALDAIRHDFEPALLAWFGVRE